MKKWQLYVLAFIYFLAVVSPFIADYFLGKEFLLQLLRIMTIMAVIALAGVAFCGTIFLIEITEDKKKK